MHRGAALVTGASSGIGFAIAKQFLRLGYRVGLHFCSNDSGVKTLASQYPPSQSLLLQGDFRQSVEVMRVWQEFHRWSETIDALVNNAALPPEPCSFESLSEESWDAAFCVNVKAPFLLSRAAFTVMRTQQSGTIINISSIGVKFGGSATSMHYSASKSALEAITRSFAKVGAPYNVRVNAIEAGVTDTPFHHKSGRTDMEQRIALIPMKRPASPEEIASVVTFLASSESSFMTGAIIPVSGGE